MHVVLAIESIHTIGINKDQDKKSVNRTLLSKPETQTYATNLKSSIEGIDEQNAKQESDGEPDGRQKGHQGNIFPPIGFSVVIHNRDLG